MYPLCGTVQNTKNILCGNNFAAQRRTVPRALRGARLQVDGTARVQANCVQLPGHTEHGLPSGERGVDALCANLRARAGPGRRRHDLQTRHRQHSRLGLAARIRRQPDRTLGLVSANVLLLHACAVPELFLQGGRLVDRDRRIAHLEHAN